MDNNINNNNNMKKNNQKFDHYFEVVLNVVYITSFVFLFGFTIVTAINAYTI